MSVQVEISYEQLVKAVQALPPQQKSALQKELQAGDSGAADEKNPWAGMSLQELLLKGPTATEEDLQRLAEVRRELEAWNTVP